MTIRLNYKKLYDASKACNFNRWGTPITKLTAQQQEDYCNLAIQEFKMELDYRTPRSSVALITSLAHVLTDIEQDGRLLNIETKMLSQSTSELIEYLKKIHSISIFKCILWLLYQGQTNEIWPEDKQAVAQTFMSEVVFK